ncbi:DNA packaging protein [Oenococcus oeni]|uniref:head-tail connector protein n=2 Tax=Oenococcus oeni TaxID=1247 RepID=UPI000277B680|nr:head-tail connector protein [Oenococcus oeni]EJO02418.1 DNA packaging, phage associated protein [Oenococcus oeni AWRIB318]EKP91256.1 DNA packaging, phage associated protein [Oenococcus oeni AWRIB202]OIK63809.1 DNA packaging protein [Oenococcus oeni]OIK63840.1 DNA packaging protein [Oenococcus oeni]OIK71972.1 DNA packaging protein [Oenococcus oeni]
MTVELDDFKISQRVDNDQDDNLIKGYLAAATAYVTNGVGADDDQATFYSRDDVRDLFDTAVQAIAGAYYQQRAALSNISVVPVSLVSDSIIDQLRAMWEQWQQSLEEQADGN